MKKNDSANRNLHAKLPFITQGVKNCRGIVKPVILLGVILLFFSSFAWSEDISKELQVDHKIVLILENEGLVPNVVIAKRGTTVIWVNYSTDPKEIKFLKSQVKTACRNPVNFFINKSGAFQSNKLETGSVASLCFIDKGEYEYEFKRTGEWADVRPQRFQGAIRIY